MTRIFKTIDLLLQTGFYGIMCYTLFYELLIKNRDLGPSLFGSMLISMAPIGIWHGISALVHAFLPKTWQLIPHRKRYGWGVIAYFVAMPLAFVLADGNKDLMPVGITVFFSAVPLGVYYFWIGWQEWRLQRNAQ